jgi:hypothetical protein
MRADRALLLTPLLHEPPLSGLTIITAMRTVLARDFSVAIATLGKLG